MDVNTHNNDNVSVQSNDEALTKQQLKKDIMKTSLALAAFIITVNLLAVIISSVSIAFNSDIQSMMMQYFTSGKSYNDIINDPVYLNAVTEATGAIMGPSMIISSIAAVFWLMTIRGKNLFGSDLKTANEKVSISVILKIFVLVMGVQFISTVITIGLNPLLDKVNLSLTDALEMGMGALFSTPWGILAGVLIVPVIEEIVFRGAILRKLQPYGLNFAIVMSSLLFALYHMILLQAFFAFFIGLLLAYAATRFSLKWSVLIHVLNNSYLTVKKYLILYQAAKRKSLIRSAPRLHSLCF